VTSSWFFIPQLMQPPSSGQRIFIRVDEEWIGERHSVLIHDPARRQKQKIMVLNYFNCSPSLIYHNVSKM